MILYKGIEIETEVEFDGKSNRYYSRIRVPRLKYSWESRYCDTPQMAIELAKKQINSLPK